MDCTYIVFGYLNIAIQYDINEEYGHHEFYAKAVNIVFLLFMLIKSFFFVRMADDFTKIVLMISRVVKDLRVFLVFYVFIMAMLSLVLSILGVGSLQDMPNPLQREVFLERAREPGNVLRYPGDEYKGLPEILKNFLIIMRFSLGDFDFDAVGYLSGLDRNIFYLTWVLMVVITCIIFLNFVIAEVNQSYERVTQNVSE